MYTKLLRKFMLRIANDNGHCAGGGGSGGTGHCY